MDFLLCLASFLLSAQPPADREAALERGRTLMRQLLTGDAAAPH